MGASRIDVDQHLFESRSTWADHIDPAFADDALVIADDERGWPWLTFRGRHLYPVEVQHPGNPHELGENRRRMAAGEPAPGRYEDLLPPAYGSADARLKALDEFRLDASVLFPNFGLLWERALAGDRDVRRANLRAFNRWMSEVVADGHGRLFGVGHLCLDDPRWAAEEIARLAAGGVRLAMVAPSPVDGKPFSDPDFDPVWTAFSEHGVAMVFHVSSFQSPIDEAWHQGDPEPVDRLLDSVFLSTAPAVAIAHMTYHGTFQRFPEFRLGVVELTAGWVPRFLLHLDGAFDFYVARHEWYRPLDLRPSEYFRRQVRVAALPYELPAHLVPHVGEETFMFGSDWPHAEGVRSPLAGADQAAGNLSDSARTKLLGANAAWLLGLEAA